MKGIKCLTSYLLKHWAFCFCLLSSLALLGFASPTSALEYSGNATSSWVGIQDATNTVPNPNDNICDGWHMTGTMQTCSPTYSSTKANVYGVTNISHHTDRLYISPSAYSSGSLDVSGTVRVITRVNAANASTYPIRDLPSNYTPFNANAFGFGIDTNSGVYDADSVTITSFKSNSTNHGDFVNISYDISFKAHYNTWTDSGNYYFSWRLNGRAVTNGGMGQMWAPYQIPIGPGTYSRFTFVPAQAAYVFNIAENGQPPVDPSQYDKKFDELNNSLGDLKTQNNTIIGQNQQIIDGQNKTNENLENINNTLTDPTIPDSSDIANEGSLPPVGLLPPGALDSILLMPLNIMNSILSSLGGSCSPIIAPLPFVDQSLTLPCFGDTIYKGDFEPLANVIGVVGAAFILFGYFKHLYKKVDRAVSLETSEEDEWGVL